MRGGLTRCTAMLDRRMSRRYRQASLARLWKVGNQPEYRGGGGDGAPDDARLVARVPRGVTAEAYMMRSTARVAPRERRSVRPLEPPAIICVCVLQDRPPMTRDLDDA